MVTFKVKSSIGSVLTAAITMLAVTAFGEAGMAAPAAAKPGVATLQGRVIDLAVSWQDAQTCLVFAPTDTRCFASHQEADRMLGYSRASDPLSQRVARSNSAIDGFAVPACSSGWLCLYADINGGGRRLQFKDEGWQYLADWGFDRQTSSWRNNQGSSDVGHLSLYNRSTVYNCGANTYANSMGVYNDQAYAVWA